MNKNLKAKIHESLTSVLPIALIVTLLCFTIVPVSAGTYLLFVLGVVFLIFGMGLFTLGADIAMLPMGERVGAKITESKKIWLITLVSFVIGMLVTIAEPDLTVLAQQIPGINDWVFIIVVAVGVGVFLVIAMLRIIFKIPLKYILIFFYIAVFITAIFVPANFLPISFDSGGVTTGPITVPFILALGMGVASVRLDKTSKDDSFGLVALSSLGPILAVLILGIVYNITDPKYEATTLPDLVQTRDIISHIIGHLPEVMLEVLIAITPIVVFIILFELVTKSFTGKQILKIMVGILYTFFGLFIFLAGANLGFLPMGNMLGQELAKISGGYILIPVGMILGYFIVSAEPAVHVLNKQVEKVSLGAISQRSMKYALCLGVAVAIGLAMVRLIFGFSILWVLVPGYAIALILTFFVPSIYTGIAFDSGGVASGAMVSTFVLPFVIGACLTLKGELYVLTEAFGVVAFVALTPLITIQILGVMAMRKTKKQVTEPTEKAEFIDYEEETV